MHHRYALKSLTEGWRLLLIHLKWWYWIIKLIFEVSLVSFLSRCNWVILVSHRLVVTASKQTVDIVVTTALFILNFYILQEWTHPWRQAVLLSLDQIIDYRPFLLVICVIKFISFQITFLHVSINQLDIIFELSFVIEVLISDKVIIVCISIVTILALLLLFGSKILLSGIISFQVINWFIMLWWVLSTKESMCLRKKALEVFGVFL